MPPTIAPPVPEGLPHDHISTPESVVLVRDRSRLRLVWSDMEGQVDAKRLRSACRCAACTRARVDGTLPSAFGGILIANVVAVGDYAINVVFSDGHNRGIFPWPYLRSLALTGDTSGGTTA
jgi:DUF971 family protein